MAVGSTEHMTYIAPAISCGQCVGKVQDALRQLDGVSSVQANAETKFVDIDFDPSTVSPDAIEQALADAGYPAHR